MSRERTYMFRRRANQSDTDTPEEPDNNDKETLEMDDAAIPELPDLDEPAPAARTRPAPAAAAPPVIAPRAQSVAAPIRRPEPRRRASEEESLGGGSGIAQGRTLTVGPDIELNGQISSCDRLVVEGKVEAALEGAQRIEVASGGMFKGTATVNEAEISGTFNGDLMGRERVVVRSGGRINGNVTYKILVIEEGGVIVGEISLLDDVG